MKTSGSTIARIFNPRSSAPLSDSVWNTCAPKPPIAPSSMVISTSCSRGKPQHQVGVERLGEARIGDGGRQAEGGELLGGLQRFAKPGAERQDRDLAALADDAALADLERLAFGRHLDADAFAARIAQRRRAVIDRDLGRDHVHQFGLVAGRHDDKARQAAEIGEVERAGMGRAVGADQARAVHRKPHRQRLDRDVVHDLIVAALQEGRIDRAERLVAFGRKPRREGHRVLLGDADVEGALGEYLLEQVDAGARWHRGGDADDLVVLRAPP